jgi:hypothetical protein
LEGARARVCVCVCVCVWCVCVCDLILTTTNPSRCLIPCLPCSSAVTACSGARHLSSTTLNQMGQSLPSEPLRPPPTPTPPLIFCSLSLLTSVIDCRPPSSAQSLSLHLSQSLSLSLFLMRVLRDLCRCEGIAQKRLVPWAATHLNGRCRFVSLPVWAPFDEHCDDITRSCSA